MEAAVDIPLVEVIIGVFRVRLRYAGPKACYEADRDH
jgi:hypothetical protein